MTYLATILQSFFTDYVHTQRSLSANTIASYRDTWKILIKYLASTSGTAADELRLEALDRAAVTGFLAYLRDDRANAAATRNHRLTAIRSLAAFALPDHLEHAECLRQILAIKPSKTPTPTVAYLSDDEVLALLAAPVTTSWIGRRDQAMLALTVATGLRISELIALTIGDVDMGASPFINCVGKGRKHRVTPLTVEISQQMRHYLDERTQHPGTALFPGRRGRSLSRDAIESRLAVHVASAALSCPSITSKQITWHTLRHTTAMNLLHSGVDITVIALWLGHEQTSTTDVYLHADMETKKQALEQTRSPEIEPGVYAPAPRVLAWLDSL
ncbi:tyrosine-type recombinase/integrase [Brevibacterium aurantiacum]|uniref:tyrosine-type recombinase/integrase n=1 Tax=Brevibacterium aurantiacum TaxID=273384 RepID=UPI001868F62A|nr:tyrosine-type recombinase/integrase [Brevibacterium aurantiacum]MDN5910879.1 site-specific integrase [Brevibacterium sp.]